MAEDAFYSPVILDIVKAASNRQREGAIYVATGWQQQASELHTSRETLINALEHISKALETLKSITSDKDALGLIDDIFPILNWITKNAERFNGIDSYVSEFLRDLIRYSKQTSNEVKSAKKIQTVINKDNDYFDNIHRLHNNLMLNLSEKYPNTPETTTYTFNQQKNET